MTNAELQALLKQFSDDMDISISILANELYPPKWFECDKISLKPFFGINTLDIQSRIKSD